MFHLTLVDLLALSCLPTLLERVPGPKADQMNWVPRLLRKNGHWLHLGMNQTLVDCLIEKKNSSLRRNPGCLLKVLMPLLFIMSRLFFEGEPHCVMWNLNQRLKLKLTSTRIYINIVNICFAPLEAICLRWNFIKCSTLLTMCLRLLREPCLAGSSWQCHMELELLSFFCV